MATPKLTDSQKRQLNEKQLAYVVWRGTPAPLRQPKSEDEIRVVLGVTRTTVWRWRQDPRVLDAIRYVTLQYAGEPDKVTEILNMVFNKAVTLGDLKAAELWLKSVGVNTAFTRDNTILDVLDETDFADYSEEELERMLSEAQASVQEDKRIAAAKEVLAVHGVETE